MRLPFSLNGTFLSYACRRNVFLPHAVIRHFCSNEHLTPKIAIVGSGPAGFYTAQHILKNHPTAVVDIYEKLPVPFGLVRYGVAPDHPEVKNVINTFTQTATNDRCRFLGNIDVGRDVSLSQLHDAYTAVVLSYGADDDRKCGVPGEELTGVHSARAFVGWYNGLPQNRQFDVDLTSTDTAVVIGHGNVAIDVARILLMPVDVLAKTDITGYALEALSTSRVRRVMLVGRRGPLQVAFTTAELREIIRLEGCQPQLNPVDFQDLQQTLSSIPRPRKRLTELMIKTALNPEEKDLQRWTKEEKSWELKFLRSPKQFMSTDGKTLSSVKFYVNKLEGSDIQKQVAIPQDEVEEIDCGLAFRSIGYTSNCIDDAIPFDSSRGVIPNKLGRVENTEGLYCSGWVKRGPVGVIVSTMNDGFETGATVVQDLKEGRLVTHPCHSGYQRINEQLKEKGHRVVSFSHWERLDAVEQDIGCLSGKPREKIASIQQMLDYMGV